MTILGVQFWRPIRPHIWPEGYRWWTCSVSRNHLKVGPVALCWYQWIKNRWHLDIAFLSGYYIVTIPTLRQR